LRYWDWNVHGSLCLLQAMEKHAVKTFVFSSSATVYGDPVAVPIREDARVVPTNPYGETKAAVEQMFADLAVSDPSWRIARLRYFNPVGAHESALIGETPQGVPNNLMPYVTQV
jgi:UDP-glucose 4-epimerase